MKTHLQLLTGQLIETRERQRKVALVEKDMMCHIIQLVEEVKKQSDELVEAFCNKNFSVAWGFGESGFEMLVQDREYDNNSFEIRLTKREDFILTLTVGGEETARSTNVTTGQIFNYISLGLKQV